MMMLSASIPPWKAADNSRMRSDWWREVQMKKSQGGINAILAQGPGKGLIRKTASSQMVLCQVCKGPCVAQIRYHTCECCGKPAKWFKPCYICKHWAGVHGKTNTANQCFVMASDEKGIDHEVCICCVGKAEMTEPFCLRCPRPAETRRVATAEPEAEPSGNM